MRRSIITTLLVCLALPFAGCASRDLQVAPGAAGKPIRTVVHMADDGNSNEMDEHLLTALESLGIAVKGSNALGDRRSDEADAVVAYVDAWRFEPVTYLRTLTVRLYAADSGELLASATWTAPLLPGYRDPEPIVKGVLKDLLARLNAR
jgi:hypothetical protein